MARKYKFKETRMFNGKKYKWFMQVDSIRDVEKWRNYLQGKGHSVRTFRRGKVTEIWYR